ncbi:ABC transporter substrate-binding protein [Vibrio harveyi]
MNYKIILIGIFLPALVNATYIEEINNCGTIVPLESASRIVSLNQQVTEALIAINADNKLLGGAYRDDKPAKKWEKRFKNIKNLSKEYPNKELLLMMKPDLLIAGFSSAYSNWGVGSRETWKSRNVNTYLFSSGCKRNEFNLEVFFNDMENLGKLTDNEDNANKWIVKQRARLENLKKHDNKRKPKILLWLREYDIPYVAGCCGTGNFIIKEVGGINIAEDLPKQWGHLSWEAIIKRQPDLIVMVNSNWSSFEQKKKYLQENQLFELLKAVQKQSYLSISFSEAVPGVRIIDGIEKLSYLIGEGKL